MTSWFLNKKKTMIHTQENHQRKRINILDRELQWSLVLKSIYPLILFLGIAAIGLGILIQSFRKTFYFENINELILRVSTYLGSNVNSDKIFSDITFWAFLSLGIVSIMLISYVVYIFLVASHRIAGPMHRFQTVIEKVGMGELSIKVPLRKKDKFKNTAKALESSISNLNQKITEIKNLNNSLLDSLLKVNEADIKTRNSDDYTSEIKNAATLAKKIQEKIKEFKLS